MARAPDNATYVSDEQPMYISKELAAKYNADPTPFSGKQSVTVYNAPGGPAGSIQFNNSNIDFGGSTGFTFNSRTNSVNILGNLNVGGHINGKFYTNIANFIITGGNPGDILITDGDGNLNWTPAPDIVASDWDATAGISQILNKPNLAVFATTANLTSSLNNYVTTSTFDTRISNIENSINNLSVVSVTGSYINLTDTPTSVSQFINDSDYISNSQMVSYVTNYVTAQIDNLKANVETEYDTLKELADQLRFLLSININGGDASGAIPIDGSTANSQYTNILDGGNA